MTTMSTNVETLTVNGVEYVRADKARPQAIPGKRALFVIDRGWVVTGDVTETNGRIMLGRPVHVRSWAEIGFDGMVANPKSTKVVLRALPEGFDMPADAEVFRIWVSDEWGL